MLAVLVVVGLALGLVVVGCTLRARRRHRGDKRGAEATAAGGGIAPLRRTPPDSLPHPHRPAGDHRQRGTDRPPIARPAKEQATPSGLTTPDLQRRIAVCRREVIHCRENDDPEALLWTWEVDQLLDLLAARLIREIPHNAVKSARRPQRTAQN